MSNIQSRISDHKKRIEHLIEAIAANGYSLGLKEALNKEENAVQELEQYLNLAEFSSPEEVEKIARQVNIDAYFLEIANRIKNPDTRKEAFHSLVKEVSVDCLTIDCLKVQLIENSEKTLSSFLELLQKYDSRIRLQTGTRSIPYTSHEWRLIITTDRSISADEAGCKVYYVDKGINDRRSNRNDY